MCALQVDLFGTSTSTGLLSCNAYPVEGSILSQLAIQADYHCSDGKHLIKAVRLKV
jgi:hypothetical protein